MLSGGNGSSETGLGDNGLGGCEVWWAPPSLVVPAGVHSPHELRRAARYRHQVDAQRFLVGAALVRRLCGELLGLNAAAVLVERHCSSCATQHGPPRVPNSGVHVSVTHAGDVVGVAISVAPVGVDVEPAAAAERVWEVRRQVCAADQPCVDPAEALAHWVAKEAALKATGDGLRVPMTDLRLDSATHPPQLALWAGRDQLARRLHLAPVPCPGHVATVAMLVDPTAAEPVPVRAHTITHWT